MSTLLFGMNREAAELPDENVVRRNTFPVNPADPPAVQDAAPDPNEVETDSNPNLGIVNRQLASAWTEGTQTAPFWQGQADAPHNNIVNVKVASDGTAAAREASGTFGHGSASFAEGIEPVGDLGAWDGYGNEYFERDPVGIQSTAGDYMSATPDLIGTRQNAALANERSRDAYQSSGVTSIYNTFYKGTVG